MRKYIKSLGVIMLLILSINLFAKAHDQIEYKSQGVIYDLTIWKDAVETIMTLNENNDDTKKNMQV